jgi:hypothetical protein
VQTAKAALSRLHSNLLAATLSVPVTANLMEAHAVVPPFGTAVLLPSAAEMIAVSGGVAAAESYS